MKDDVELVDDGHVGSRTGHVFILVKYVLNQGLGHVFKPFNNLTPRSDVSFS